MECTQDARLKWSKLAEQEVRKELHQIAISKCKDTFKAYRDCSIRENMMVVFNCRAEIRGMNECLGQYTNDAALEAYKAKRGAELAALAYPPKEPAAEQA
ncbi:hypothetical protein M885DRAFT_530659 [Pelagophyceae sp. CCMP2097]|nr:hypothetical protein M885DRAFT_530659 [Pelagophyceae sp. CCMP2097]|mmetsp:Transcript_2654/g.7796  ORF Transcript_2654/g.7796 Transcript_2654/m.7796 type:complete len:100 (+) Transcript_2654:83-382(+)